MLDTRSYIVEFDDNDQMELTANLIAKSLYAQYDPDGNLWDMWGPTALTLQQWLAREHSLSQNGRRTRNFQFKFPAHVFHGIHCDIFMWLEI